ncbi:hypothetical protein [Allosalinactinospora lopnorensis]|uniref:hypothetical protein n=1 Tax=Allosalinactinospora lopnorensis TaxID=1352348 RepID=UPI000697CCF7|nr:hypothetical protein [Allosalinactinospora lopnorensis]
MDTAVEARILRERGQTSTCTVLQVDKRVVTRGGTGVVGPVPGPPVPPHHHGPHHDPPGATTTTTYYDHRLDCVEVPEMTTEGSRAGKVGERIDVLYDPTDRLDPRPADEAPPVERSLLTAASALPVGIALRLTAVFDAAVERALNFVLRCSAGFPGS